MMARLLQQPLDAETVAAIIRITSSNFRLLNRLLTQIERTFEINVLKQVTETVVKGPMLGGREKLDRSHGTRVL
jgi:hypothetical protein